MARRGRAALVGVLALAAVVAVVLALARPTPPAAAPRQPVHPTSSSGPPPGADIGTLVTLGDPLDQHFCTAAVLHSPAGDLVVTAAHCLGDTTPTTLGFVPGYHDGTAPYGVWPVGRAVTDPRWDSDADPDLDVAFLVIARPGLEATTGALSLGLDRGFTNPVTVTGYPNGGQRPVTCTGSTVRQDTYQLRVDCPGLVDGTSGSPWVTGPGNGTLVGVVGGYEEGGASADTSYSPYLDKDTAALYRAATGQPPR